MWREEGRVGGWREWWVGSRAREIGRGNGFSFISSHPYFPLSPLPPPLPFPLSLPHKAPFLSPLPFPPSPFPIPPSCPPSLSLPRPLPIPSFLPFPPFLLPLHPLPRPLPIPHKAGFEKRISVTADIWDQPRTTNMGSFFAARGRRGEGREGRRRR